MVAELQEEHSVTAHCLISNWLLELALPFIRYFWLKISTLFLLRWW